MNDVAAEKSDLWRENPHRVGKETDDVKNNTTYAFQNLNENWFWEHKTLMKTHQLFTKAVK